MKEFRRLFRSPKFVTAKVNITGQKELEATIDRDKRSD